MIKNPTCCPLLALLVRNSLCLSLLFGSRLCSLRLAGNNSAAGSFTQTFQNISLSPLGRWQLESLPTRKVTLLSFQWSPSTNLQLPPLFKNLAVRLLCSRSWSLAAIRWARVLTTLLMVLRWATPEVVHVNMGCCLRLVHLAFVSVCLPLSAHLSAISLKNSPLCDLILTKRVNSPKSILALSNSRIFRRMSPSGDALMDRSIPSPIHFWIAIRRHLESVSRISSLLLPSRAMHAAACSALLEDEPSSSLPTLQKPPVSPSCL